MGSAGLRILNAGLGFAVAIVLARALGSDGYGLYSAAFVTASICAIAVQLGLPNLVMRETAIAIVSKDLGHLRAVWVWAGRSSILFSVVMLAVGLSALLLLKNELELEQIYTYGLALALIPLFAFAAIRAGALRGLQHVVLAQLPEMIVKPGVMLVFALMLGLAVPATASNAMGMQLIATGCAVLLGTILLMKYRPAQLNKAIKYSLDSKDVFWKAALTMGFAAGMNHINNYSDILIIGVFRPVEEVGLYRISYQISILCSFGLQIVSVVFAQSYVHLYRKGNYSELQALLTKGAIIATSVALIVALPWFVFGAFLLGWLFGPDFIASWPSTMILIVAQIINASFGAVGMLMQMTGHERYVARFMLLSAAINLLLNLAIIPFYGALGAAATTLVTLLIWNISLGWMAWRHLSLNCHVTSLFSVIR